MSQSQTKPKDIDDVYRERNLLVCAFLRALDYHAYRNYEMGWWPDPGVDGDEAWCVVWVNLDHGQVGWHLPGKMVPRWIPQRDPEYDGYSTETKNERVEKYAERMY